MIRFLHVIFMALTIHSCLLAVANAQNTRDVVRAFLKLDAKIETGLSLHDYNAALADVKFELKNLESDSINASQAPAIKELQTAMTLYAEASQLWRLSIGRYRINFLQGRDAATYLERYPESGKGFLNGGATVPGMGLDIEKIIPFIWRDASKHVDGARAILEQTAKEVEQPQVKSRKGKKPAT